ncbi:MAG: transposase [Gammaproteobacteria bacterium]
MPRQARILLPGVTLHLLQRSNNRSDCFYAEDDYLYYCEILKDQAKKHGCAIHAWCLMSNHIHLLLTPLNSGSVGLMMKGLNQRYVQYINRYYHRSGTIWEGRFHSCLMNEDDYVLACYRYIELNPVTAGLVAHPSEYRWSSYRGNAHAELSSLISPHPLYQSFGESRTQQSDIYREHFRYQINPNLVDQIRTAINGNYAVGSPRFTSEIESAAGRKVTRGRPGRPRKTPRTEFSLLEPTSTI